MFVVKNLKVEIKLLFGAPLFTPNLAHFGQWDGLINDCKAMALELGLAMQKYFEDSQLGVTLGTAAPNLFGRLQLKSEGSSAVSTSDIWNVVPCSEKECTKRQDGVLPMVFPRNPDCSQVQPYNTDLSCPKYDPVSNAGSLSRWHV